MIGITIVDRKSKFTLMRKLPSKETGGVANAIIELLYPLKKLTHTITSDNGKEFTLHEKIAKRSTKYLINLKKFYLIM